MCRLFFFHALVLRNLSWSEYFLHLAARRSMLAAFCGQMYFLSCIRPQYAQVLSISIPPLGDAHRLGFTGARLEKVAKKDTTSWPCLYMIHISTLKSDIADITDKLTDF
jgi:hypothetical protein